ncbi:MAG: hypothetical protein JXR50_08955 [Prolixibacteraceae bacterium]|nr:hypothetical protein [Prolixibacteraceae bacterium]MBN2649854.1 hypothetical protein [Prolixibacteraceae bacterium]
MRKLSNFVIVVALILFFTCICISSEKCTIHDNPIYIQDELHIPGIYISKYIRKSISTNKTNKQLKNTEFSRNALEATNDSTKQTDLLNIYGIHIPSHIKNQIAKK